MSVIKPMRKCFFVALQLALSAALWGQQPTISSVSISTDPPFVGLKFYVDGQLFRDAATLFWPAGSTHSLSLLSNIQSGNVDKARYVFSNWSTNLGPITNLTDLQTITADPGLTWIKATFGVQYEVDLVYWVCLPSPEPCGSPGTVSINGVDAIQNVSNFYSAGALITVEAHPAPGNIFVGWGQVPGSGNTTQTYVNSYHLTNPISIYPIFQTSRPVNVTINSNPPGLQILLDRTPMYSPATVQWGSGTTHYIGALTPQTDSLGNSWVFGSWSDGSAVNHAFTMPAFGSPQPLKATFTPATRVTFLTNPPGLNLNVDGRTNWPNLTFTWGINSTHTVTAMDQTDATGQAYTFASWSDNAGGATRNFVASANGEVNRYTANFQAAAGPGPVLSQTPTIAPAGIVNAAGLTPESILSPGSVVSVYGNSLAPTAEVAPGSPLPQTMANVTASVAGRLLPLFYVSPSQVNLQIPSDLSEGDQTLTVSRVGNPDTSAGFTVARNAPGLFSQWVNGQSFAAATHADGSEVTTANPARKGETITLYATGVGPTNHALLDGFAVPANSNATYMDPVYVEVGESILPASAVPAAGTVGLGVIRFSVGAGFTSGTNNSVKVQVNGHESNTVLLPVK